MKVKSISFRDPVNGPDGLRQYHVATPSYAITIESGIVTLSHGGVVRCVPASNVVEFQPAVDEPKKK